MPIFCCSGRDFALLEAQSSMCGRASLGSQRWAEQILLPSPSASFHVWITVIIYCLTFPCPGGSQGFLTRPAGPLERSQLGDQSRCTAVGVMRWERDKAGSGQGRGEA